MQWRMHHPFETTADPVIAKGPEVMPDTVTQHYRLEDHAECLQTLRLCQINTENTSSSSLTKLKYI